MSTPYFPCGHERRPGTTVCLRCRHESHRASRKRLRRRGAAVLGVAIVVSAAVAGALSLVNAIGESLSAQTRLRPAPRVIATPAVAGAPTLPAPAAADSTTTIAAAAEPSAPAESAPAAAVAPAPETVAAVPAAPAVAMVVPEGRTDLGDGVEVVRAGDTARVRFDTPGTRTRVRARFDALVRRTLPTVYGARIDSLLPSIDAEPAQNQGDLLAELPTRGLRYALSDGSTLELWPETRPGRDGPLVVAYRTTVTR